METNKRTIQDATTLDEALSNQNTAGRPMKAFVGVNCGSRTFSLLMNLFEIQEFTEIANKPGPEQAQRPLNMPHALDIAKYLLKGLLFAAERNRRMKSIPISAEFEKIKQYVGMQPYISIPPLVASFRNTEPNGTNLYVKRLITDSEETAAYKIFINTGDTFWIVDGQHRRKAIQLVYEFLNHIQTQKAIPAKNSLIPKEIKGTINEEQSKIWAECLEQFKYCSVMVEVHLGLNVVQERQLFHDLNNLGKKVEQRLAYIFDTSNPVNRFIQDKLLDDLFIQNEYIIVDKDKPQWTDPGSGLSRRDLIAINAILFLNRTTVKNAIPAHVEDKVDQALRFWELLLNLPNVLDDSAKQKTVLAQPVAVKALAKLYYDFFFGKNTEWTTEENQNKLLEGIKSFDFSHDNPILQYYLLDEKERKSYNFDGLVEYLPSETEGFNRDLGSYDKHSHSFRFGPKHNDIAPIIGDMIRWKAGLPKRGRSNPVIE